MILLCEDIKIYSFLQLPLMGMAGGGWGGWFSESKTSLNNRKKIYLN